MSYSPRGRKESDTTERLHFLSFFLSRSTPARPGGGVEGEVGQFPRAGKRHKNKATQKVGACP